ncbi:uncharacterized protein [Miscanthus floridulus]|uniref:uncharacterized protein n=1 Tax=Miscanthus floridulus TaxID=154761 RepID=UPI00345A8127
MVPALQGLGGDTTVGAHEVEPLSSMFGGSADSSNSEGNRLEAGATTTSDSEEVASKGGARSLKIPHLEESEAESEERSPPVHVQDLAPPVRSTLVEDAEIVDAAQGIMHLGGLAEAMIVVEASGDRPVVPGWDLAQEGLGTLPKAAGLLGIGGPSELGRTGGEAGSSSDTLSGWAEALDQLYQEIGDRARRHFRKVDVYTCCGLILSSSV